MKKKYFKLLIVFLVLGCSKDDQLIELIEVIEEEKEEIVNLPPNNFDVNIHNISHDNAMINWSESVDPEDEAVSYTVYLNEKLIIENISEFTHQFIDLEELTAYSGKIIANDTSNNKTEANFSFKTEKYYLKYLKTYGLGETNYGVGYASGAPYSMLKQKIITI